jgi:dGTP triphosphohydrolase
VENTRAARKVRALFDHHLARRGDPVVVTDWVSGMTDRYAERAYDELPA